MLTSLQALILGFAVALLYECYEQLEHDVFSRAFKRVSCVITQARKMSIVFFMAMVMWMVIAIIVNFGIESFTSFVQHDVDVESQVTDLIEDVERDASNVDVRISLDEVEYWCIEFTALALRFGRNTPGLFWNCTNITDHVMLTSDSKMRTANVGAR